MTLNECYIGDCREILRDMVAAGIRVQMCVTSPPYWGLRDYGIEPNVWGGSSDCEHVWGDDIKIHKGGPTGNSSGLTNRGANQARTAVKDIPAGQFCRCGAWFGTLGLEPDYRMYIDHMVEVMELVVASRTTTVSTRPWRSCRSGATNVPFGLFRASLTQMLTLRPSRAS